MNRDSRRAGMILAGLVVLSSTMAPAHTAGPPPAEKRVMLWTTRGQLGAFTNATKRAAWLAQLETVRDVVDVVSPGSYSASPTWPHSLVRHAGAKEMHAALKSAGFRVQPLPLDLTCGVWAVTRAGGACVLLPRPRSTRAEPRSEAAENPSPVPDWCFTGD
jgi:hypothetical protein